MKLRMIGDSHIGRRRKINQDSLFYDAKIGLGIVADGIGGRSGGEVASSIAVDFISKAFTEYTNPSNETIGDFLNEAIVRANNLIIKRGIEKEDFRGMGTTVNCVAFVNNKINIAHIGDSRTYLFLNGCLWRLTVDHSVSEFVRRGWLSKDVLESNSKKDALVRALGLIPGIECDLYNMEVIPGAIYLTCSDGLTAMVSEERINEIITKNFNNLEGLPKILIDEANKRGGLDNTTVLLSQVLKS